MYAPFDAAALVLSGASYPVLQGINWLSDACTMPLPGTDVKDTLDLFRAAGLYLKPIARLNVSVQLPQLKKCLVGSVPKIATN